MAKVEHPTTQAAALTKRIKFVASVEIAEDTLLLPRVNKTAETAKTRVLREAKARHTTEIILSRLFAWLKANIGVEDAWHHFHGWAERLRPQSLAGHRGPADRPHDNYLLGVYDQLAEQAKEKTGALPRLIAVKLQHDKPGKYGNSVEAIAKKIRRLLNEREDRRAIEAQVRADLQGLLHEMGWDEPKCPTHKRRVNTRAKSRDK